MLVHLLVAICATTLGAMAGLGGGVIIKPVLDALGLYTVGNVGVLSSITVFSMAAIAVFKQVRSGFEIKLNMVVLSLGSIVGGILGKYLFEGFIKTLGDEGLAKGIQGFMLAGILIFVYFRDRFKRHHIKATPLVLLVGLLLGSIASFLGVGGGPINVAVLIIFMGMDVREGAVNSIFIILLSQGAKLLTITFTEGFSGYNLSMAWVMILGAILGGFIGSHLNKKVSLENIGKLFNISIIMIILLNVYNGIQGVL